MVIMVCTYAIAGAVDSLLFLLFVWFKCALTAVFDALAGIGADYGAS